MAYWTYPLISCLSFCSFVWPNFCHYYWDDWIVSFFFGSDCNKCSFTKRKWQKLKNMCTWNSRITYIQRVVALLTRLWATTNAHHQQHLVSPIVSTCVVLPMRFQLSMSRKTNFVVYLTILFINDVLLGSIAL